METPVPAVAGSRRKMYVPVVSAEPGVGPAFVETLCQGSDGTVSLQQHQVFVETLDVNRLDEQGPEHAKLIQADAFVLLAHFLDIPSMDRVRRLYHRLMIGKNAPIGIFIFRPEEERQFKISCTECGQKLWVMEHEIGMRGRCVNCRQPMTISPPSEYIRKMLSLPDAVPVLNVVKGNAAVCRGALANLLTRIGLGIQAGTAPRPENFLKQATIPIHIPKSTPLH